MSDPTTTTPAPDAHVDEVLLAIPQLCLVVLIGTTGSGKSTFARTHFLPTEVISSDTCRGLVADDETDQSATEDAFEVLHLIAAKRLAAGRLTVVDATNVQPHARRALIELAREHHVLPVAIVFDVPERVCADRNASRPDRQFGPHVLRRQRDQLRRGLKGLAREGFRQVHELRGVDQIAAVRIERTRLYSDLRHESGPFDVIGDVHGCRAELEALLDRLGYELTIEVTDRGSRAVGARHPQGRLAVFVGDLVDRGPDTPGVLRLVMNMVAEGTALCVPGNHEHKLLRALRGAKVRVSHGLAESLEQLSAQTEQFRADVVRFLDGLISHYVLDGGRLVVSHAGLPERMHGRASGKVRAFCLYGQTTGESDEYGLPVRYPWAQDYRGQAMVLYGHTPVPEAEWVNNTMCLDTGCVFGGKLTALRYPERDLVSVPAARQYMDPIKPLAVPGAQDGAAAGGPGRPADDILDLGDVLERHGVETRLQGRVSVRPENAAAALEVITRFGLDPHWLMYLPPTMAPVPTAPAEGAPAEADLLEHPAQALAAYRGQGVMQLICQEKHMGSRAVLAVCRDQHTARARFGAPDGVLGAIWTRTGRAMLDAGRTAQVIDRLRGAAERAGLFDELGQWLLLDAELLPWNLKADELIRTQYAPIGAAAGAVLPVAIQALEQAAGAGASAGAPAAELTGLTDVTELTELTERIRRRRQNAVAYTDAYQRYCHPVDGLDGVQVAPFQVLAAPGVTFCDRPHLWHLELADRLADADAALVRRTRRLLVDLTTCDPDAAVAEATGWWHELTATGGEGMVVKPAANLAADPAGQHARPVQPGLKVRGREYLRIIYGPDYDEPRNLARLRARRLGHKRSLALREYALGIEALERLTAGEPLWRVHECVFAVLALESEPVDPRL